MIDTIERRPGRGLKLKPELADAIAESIGRGVPLTTAAIAAGVSYTQVRQWLTVGLGNGGVWADGTPVSPETLELCEDFARKVAEAAAAFEQEHLRRIADASAEPDAKGHRDWRASAWLLSNLPHTRQTYHEHKEVEVLDRRQASPEYKLMESLSEDQLQRIIEGQAVELLPAATGEAGAL